MARMSRFQQELSGQLGEFWRENALKEIAEAKRLFDEEARVDENGAVCWKNNGAYIMDDMIEKMLAAGCKFNAEATRKARDEQNDKFMTEYIARQINPTEEQLFEMRAAFGAGTTIVDAISGRKIQL